MLNWNFLSPRNFIVIGLVGLIFSILASRVMRAVQGKPK